MALLSIQNQLKNGLKGLPSYLRVPATFTYTANAGVYNPAKAAYATPVASTLQLSVVKGVTKQESSTSSTYLAEVLDFGLVIPSNGDTLVVGVDTWNISGIATDPIGILYTITVEKKDGV